MTMELKDIIYAAILFIIIRFVMKNPDKFNGSDGSLDLYDCEYDDYYECDCEFGDD